MIGDDANIEPDDGGDMYSPTSSFSPTGERLRSTQVYPRQQVNYSKQANVLRKSVEAALRRAVSEERSEIINPTGSRKKLTFKSRMHRNFDDSNSEDE